MENAITKQLLREKLETGVRPALEWLYARYSALLFGYILQFIPAKEEAESALIHIFCRLSHRLPAACHSPLSIYCWMQTEARKWILESKSGAINGPVNPGESPNFANRQNIKHNFSLLLAEASEEQRQVFGELFLNGREKEEVAREMNKDISGIDRLLRESLLIIRKKLL